MTPPARARGRKKNTGVGNTRTYPSGDGLGATVMQVTGGAADQQYSPPNSDIRRLQAEGLISTVELSTDCRCAGAREVQGFGSPDRFTRL